MPPRRRTHGPTVRAIREARHLTADELAQRCGIHKVTMWRIENGDRGAGLELAVALASQLDVDVAMLAGRHPIVGWLRRKAGITEETLARDVGIGADDLWRIETGETPPDRELAEAIAARLNVDVRVVLDEDLPAA